MTRKMTQLLPLLVQDLKVEVEEGVLRQDAVAARRRHQVLAEGSGRRRTKRHRHSEHPGRPLHHLVDQDANPVQCDVVRDFEQEDEGLVVLLLVALAVDDLFGGPINAQCASQSMRPQRSL